MPPKAITLFMWGFQPHFRRSVEWELKGSLRKLGVHVEPMVVLIGLLKMDGSGHPVCIEPEDGPMAPADFGGVHARATQLYEEGPDSRMSFSNARMHEKKHREFRHRAYGSAIREVLEAKLGPGRRFFVGLPTVVDQHLVFTTVGIPQRDLDDTP